MAKPSIDTLLSLIPSFDGKIDCNIESFIKEFGFEQWKKFRKIEGKIN